MPEKMLRASARCPRREPSRRTLRRWRGTESLRPHLPIDPASRTGECSNLSLANALSNRSDPTCIPRDRVAITGATKPDQSMKSPTTTSKTSGDDLALRFALRLLRLRLLCLLRHAALLAEWLATSMKCTIRSCTRLHVLQQKEKNTLSP